LHHILAVDHAHVGRTADDRAGVFRAGVAQRGVEVQQITDAIPHAQHRIVSRVEDVEMLAAAAGFEIAPPSSIDSLSTAEAKFQALRTRRNKLLASASNTT
jgi:hypothetical protein